MDPRNVDFKAMNFKVTPMSTEGYSSVEFKDGFVYSFAVKTKIAHLWAAAPELLEALTQLYKETADYIQINNLGDIHHNKSMKDARAAIAKAEE